MSKRRAVFLDRDGVLNQAVHLAGQSYPPRDADSLEIVPGSIGAVARFKAAGYLCIGITNQPDIARGTRTWENVGAMNSKVTTALGLDDMFVCPHDNADQCECRKPKAGMLLAAARKWDIDLSASWMIGDRETDVLAGRAAGCRTVLIRDPRYESGADTAADMICADLAAVDLSGLPMGTERVEPA